LKVFVGLGNPGLNYQRTRHNVGFRVLDRLSDKLGVVFASDKQFAADFARAIVGKETVLLAKPMTFMNDSGQCVATIKTWFKVNLKDFLIIHDDVSLPLGRIRLQKNGGAGGQHGVESIIEQVGGEGEFNRLKIGVGPDPGGEIRANYVLSPFPESDQPVLDRVLDLSEQAALAWLTQGIEVTMNQFNGINLNEDF